MESLKLSPDMRELLDGLRKNNSYLSVYDIEPDVAEKAVWGIGQPMLDALGLPATIHNQYRWFMRELSRVLRTLRGKGLAFTLEALIIKWVGYRLDPKMLEILIGCCFENLPVEEGTTMETTEGEREDGKAGRGSGHSSLPSVPLSPESSNPGPLEPSPQHASPC